MLNIKYFFALLTLAFFSQVFAVTDDFTQATNNSSNNWVAQGGGLGNGFACLTAGTTAVSATNQIPGCTTKGMISTADASGSGALRLTAAAGNQTGAIVSQNAFPTNQGLQVTFTTYTYGGDSGGTGGDGADGMSFFLQDAAYGTTVGGAPNIGAFGGSLGYSCSQSKGAGLTGAYLGLGMDEYGNFLNSGDNTATGIPNSNWTSGGGVTTYGTNSFNVSSTYQPNRIGLRGAGNVSWYWLNHNYPQYYPSTLTSANQLAAVENTCQTGTLWNYSAGQPDAITSMSNSGTTLTVTVPNHGYVNGNSVTLAGVTASVPVQNITGATVSGTTMTVTVPSVTGYVNGQSVTIGGNITATSTGGAAQNITSYSSFSSSNGNIRVYVPSVSGYSNGDTVTITGATGTNASRVNGTFTISSISTGSNYFKISVTGTSSNWSAYPSGGSVTNGSAAPPIIPGSYTISSVNTSTKTFQVTLDSAASSIINTSGTAAISASTINGSYTISGVTTNTFNVTLSSAPASGTTYTFGTATDTSQSGVSNTGTSVMDYPVIAGGYRVLPNSQLIANEATSSRTGAWPITYRLNITSGGLLTFMYSYNGGAYQSVLTNFAITTGNGTLPANFLFGFAGSTGGSTNVHEITCFLAQTLQSSSSAGANTVQSGQVRTGSKVYLSSYNSNNWAGSVVSDPITVNATTGAVTVATTADWDGNCVLTGGGCTAMGTDANGNAINTITVEPPASRQLLTWSGIAGIPLESANLTSAQTTVLTSTTSNATNRLDWLRGGRSNEQGASTPGILRTRVGVLGDIVDSSPLWVGAPTVNYPVSFTDALYNTTTGSETSYSNFSTSMATRLNVVYVGANDGLLHGFRAGSYAADGITYNSATNDGYEVIGFMPSTVLSNNSTYPNTTVTPNIPNVVALTNPTYSHNYFVDAAPGSGDLYYGGAWHTWLVGGMGEGGAEIYALDITDPTGAVIPTLAFSETYATNLVIGDWTSTTLTNLGKTYGTPIIRRLHNGQWALIFGNGIGSSGGVAGIYIGLVSSSGSVTFQWLPTGSSGSNGIVNVSSADLDGDFITDYLYAGDLLGNVWRFDLTSSNPLDWAASKYGQAAAAPLFASSGQPITGKIAVTVTTVGGGQRVLLGLGTGRAIPFTTIAGTTYASGTQSVYGIWDWDMNTWNAGTTTTNSVHIPASLSQYTSLAEITTSPYRTFTRSNLLANTVATQTATNRTVAISTVCWQGSTSCTSGNTQYGWLFDLPDSVSTTACGGTSCNEQITYNPILSGGELIINTTIPAANSSVQCVPFLPTGWTMAFNMASGGGTKQNVFPDSSGSLVVTSGNSSIVGVKLSGTGSVKLFSTTANGQQITTAVTQTVNNTPASTTVNTQGAVKVKRVSWKVLR